MDQLFSKYLLKRSVLPDYTVDTFSGLVTAIKDTKVLPKGAAQDAVNWLTGTYKDHIELSLGTALLGQTRNTGAGKITGLIVGTKPDGTRIPFFSYGRKIKYYDAATDDTIESGSNVLPAAADGDDVSFEFYSNIAGAFIYASSINSSINKIPVANPGSVVDQLSTTYRGIIRIKQGRMFLWQRQSANGFKDFTGINLSYIDKALASLYTQVTGESFGTGDGVTTTFVHTAASIAAKRTIFLATVTDGVETFIDDKSGNMVGSLGGTGTINYATGVVSVTFATAPINLAALTETYYWEDSTSTGICDFSFSNPRTVGQGNYYPQADGGGNFQNLFSIGGDEYCLHALKTWVLTLTGTDTSATNLIYRNKVGIPYWRAALETGDGVPYVDNTNPNKPDVRVLQPSQFSPTVIPKSIADQLDLSSYSPTKAVMYEWGNYWLVSLQEALNGVFNANNSLTFLYNKIGKFWDKTDIPATCFGDYAGQLLAGDPLSNNIFKVLSGYDADGDVINNYWIGGDLNLGSSGIKKFYRFVIDGFIARDQSFDIYLAYDSGQFGKILVNGETDSIRGDGDYVDSSFGITVGSSTVGEAVVGSGGTPNAYHFRREFVVASDRFEYVKPKFVATRIGALQINSFTFKDVRYKGHRSLPSYQGSGI